MCERTGFEHPEHFARRPGTCSHTWNMFGHEMAAAALCDDSFEDVSVGRTCCGCSNMFRVVEQKIQLFIYI